MAVSRPVLLALLGALLVAYRGVTGGVGVSRAPAIVILGGKGSARVIEGFVDRETLAQEVTDTR